MTRLLVDVREAAEMLGCGRTLIYQLIGAGHLPTVKIGRLTRIPVEALETFVADSTTPRTQNVGPQPVTVTGARAERK